MDFRKADPTYLGFKPKTAEEAIDLFYRNKRLGVPVHLWPEVFVKCAADLKDSEMDKFESWLVNPQGEPTGSILEAVDTENEKLRKQLLAEATRRDMKKIDEDDEKVDVPEQPPSEDTISDAFADLSTDAVMDFEMVKPSGR